MVSTNSKKKFSAALSIVSNSVLILIKTIAGIISGSVSIISEALHSFADVIASILAYYSVFKSSKPADEDHPWGHGKYEDLAGFIEAILIILTGLYIIFIACEKILTNGGNHEIQTTPGIIIMLVSIVVNWLVSSHLFKIARETESIALETDAEHLRADILTSFGIIAGLIAVRVTGLNILDPIIAIIVACAILKTGFKLTKQSSDNLLDCSLPKKECRKIEEIVASFKDSGVICTKRIRTSKAGSKRLVHIVIMLPPEIILIEAHKLCDKIEAKIKQKLKNCVIIIHTEPFMRDIES